MAARTLRPKHSDEIRAKIQASMLINGLYDNFTGKKNLSPGQIKSAEILLRKSVPDLSAVEMTAQLDVKGEVGLRPMLTRQEWLDLHKAK